MDGRVVAASAVLAGAGLFAWTGWGAYVNRTTEQVPYTEVETVGDPFLWQYNDPLHAAVHASQRGRN